MAGIKINLFSWKANLKIILCNIKDIAEDRGGGRRPCVEHDKTEDLGGGVFKEEGSRCNIRMELVF